MKFSSPESAQKPRERKTMTSPATALIWEIWQRHRARLITIALTILAFALVYPKLCVLAGINLNSESVLDDIVTSQRWVELPTWPKVLRGGTIVFLLLAPMACMGVSFLYVIWVFTMTNLEPKQLVSFPARLFTLPVSTTFLAGWLMALGTATVLALYLCWTRFVQLPHMEVFSPFFEGRGAFDWVVLLILSQAVAWSLANFPFFRILVWVALLYCFAGYPSLSPDNILRQNEPWFLLTLLLAGGAMAHTGLSKIRCGEWQTWRWRWRFPLFAGIGGKAPMQFHSTAEAQAWFNWRRFGYGTFLIVCVLTWLPIILIAPEVMLHGRIDGENTHGLCMYLLSVPLFIHFAHGASPNRSSLPFVMLRPMTSGEIVVSELKTLARSTLLSWAVTAAALCVVPLLGDVAAAAEQMKSLTHDPQFISLAPLLLLGLVFLSWRFSVVNFGFSATGNRWALHIPGVAIIGFVIAFGTFNFLENYSEYREILFRILVALLSALLLLKMILAKWAFGVAIRRQLLARATAKRYLVLWVALAFLFLVPPIIVFRHERGVLPLSLFIILLLPLARIGFAPVGLDIGRHR
jgi:hypothetical protein